MNKNRTIKVIPRFTGYKDGVLCFRTGATPEDVYSLERYAFDNLVDTAGIFGPSAIRLLYEQMVMGASFPNAMILNHVSSYQNVLAATLYIDPSLVFEDRCAPLVYTVDKTSRFGDVGMAHVPQKHLDLLYSIRQTLADHNVSTVEDEYNRLHLAAQVVSEYLRTGVIHGDEADETEMFDIVKEYQDFVAVESNGPANFYPVYRKGFLCVVWFSGSRVVIGKKTSLVPYFDVRELANRLDHREFGASVEGSGWLQDFDPSMITSPTKNPSTGADVEGTSLSQGDIIDEALEVYGDQN